MLKLEGFAVSAAADGREGVRLAQSEKPDLIVCDVMMPGLDGHGVIAALRAKPALAATPFLFLTARGARADVRNGMDLGAEELLRAIRTRLARHEQIARAGARLPTLGAKKLEPRNTRKAGEKERTREAGERGDHESVRGNFLQPQLRNRRARIRRRPARGAACARSIRSFSNRGSV